MLTTSDVNEIADAPPGVVQKAIESVIEKEEKSYNGSPTIGNAGNAGTADTGRKTPKMNIASVRTDGKVKIVGTNSFEQLTK